MIRRQTTRALVIAAATMIAMAACGRTPGRAIAFAIAVRGATPAGSFVTATGWTVTLEQADVALGPIYVYAPDRAPSAIALLDAIGPAIARAHGGHDPFGERELRAELLEQRTIDALDGTARELGLAVGSEGESSDLVIALEPPRDGTATLAIAGLAERDGVAIPFRGALDFEDEGLARFVEGIPVAAHMDDRGALELSVRAERWLDKAHFDRLTVRDGDRFVITAGDQVSNAWRLGARHPDTYAARWIPTEVAQ